MLNQGSESKDECGQATEGGMAGVLARLREVLQPLGLQSQVRSLGAGQDRAPAAPPESPPADPPTDDPSTPREGGEETDGPAAPREEYPQMAELARVLAEREAEREESPSLPDIPRIPDELLDFGADQAERARAKVAGILARSAAVL